MWEYKPADAVSVHVVTNLTAKSQIVLRLGDDTGNGAFPSSPAVLTMLLHPGGARATYCLYRRQQCITYVGFRVLGLALNVWQETHSMSATLPVLTVVRFGISSFAY